MSEELMQKFAVVDRELRVLDVIRDEQVIVSFVPRGLWLIGTWGRIDMITRDRTITVVAIKENGHYEWKFAPSDNRYQLSVFRINRRSYSLRVANKSPSRHQARVR